jgi:hypothetical protein
MIQQNSQKQSYHNLLQILIGIVIVLAYLCIRLLLVNNVGGWNEADVLPLAKQYVDPNWIPGDWYLNQPPSYRILFQSFFGRLIVAWGFLTTSIVGRLICYSLIASGLVLITRQMGLNLVMLLLAIRLFLRENQGLVAKEWLVSALETKAVAYGLVLLAIAFMLKQRYRWMALLVGLATSFHVLVGGYTFLTFIGWLLVRHKTRLPSWKEWGWILLIYLTGSIFALQAVSQQLFTPQTTGDLASSFIYVFIRLPHHLNPLSWREDWWVMGLFYLLTLAVSLAVICFYRPYPDLAKQRQTCIDLFDFTLISLIPFVIGLAIAPFDSQGRLLQYYPFRLGDIMLPLTTCLLFTRALQHLFTGKTKQKLFLIICCLLLSIHVVRSCMRLPNDIQQLSQFPNESQGETVDSKNLYAWVRNNTPKDTTFIMSPTDLLNFTWMAERPIIAKSKFMPQTKSAIWEWYKRLCDLNGVEQLIDKSKNINQGYASLTTEQIKALMVKYNATYAVTKVKHKLDLPIVYSNKSYKIYQKSQS